MNADLNSLKYKKLYELGREEIKGFSRNTDLVFKGYYLGRNSNGELSFAEIARDKVIMHIASEYKTISFPDHNLNPVRDVVCINESHEITNYDLEIHIRNILSLSTKKTLESQLI